MKRYSETNTSTPMVNSIVECCRQGNIWAVRRNLREVRPSEQATLLNKCDRFGDTALGVASSNGHITLTEFLISIPGVDPNKATEKTKFTPLMLAATQGNEKIVKLLLKLPTIDKAAISINRMTADAEALYANQKKMSDLIRAKM